VHFKVGDKVIHPKFGKGKIVSLGGVGQFQKAVIFFDLAGRKPLMLQFAKLEKI
jgi:DNA helicase-2/ATP-dependent DNA helicase PcrA